MPIHAVRRAVRGGLATAGLFDLAIRRRSFGGAVVLCYHAIRPDRQPDGEMPFEGLHVRRSLFREHCRIVSRLCHPISLATWRDASRGRKALPARPVLITFDDGYRSVLTEALAVLEEFTVPAVLFACSEPLERQEMFWHDAVAMAQGEGAVAQLKRVGYAEWRQAVDARRQSVSARSPVAPLAPAEIESLATHPLVEIGGHTHRHPVLANADEAAQRAEILENLDVLSSWTRRRPEAFAYPIGRYGADYTAIAESIVADAAVTCAFGTDEGIARVEGSPLRAPRFTMTAGLTAAHLLHRLAWLWQ